MTKKIAQFKDLKVWQNAPDLGVEIFKLCESGKSAKDHGSKDQIRKAAFSISKTVAGGFEYNNQRVYPGFEMCRRLMWSIAKSVEHIKTSEVYFRRNLCKHLSPANQLITANFKFHGIFEKS